MAKHVYYLVGVDSDHKPECTTRVCAEFSDARAVAAHMKELHHDVFMCSEVGVSAGITEYMKALEKAQYIFDPTFDCKDSSEPIPKVALLPKDVCVGLLSALQKLTQVQPVAD